MRQKLAAALTLVLLMSACGPRVSYETQTRKVGCEALHEVLPTYSQDDTTETLESGDAFLTRFFVVCPPPQ